MGNKRAGVGSKIDALRKQVEEYISRRQES
jgi:hypothetical protein